MKPPRLYFILFFLIVSEGIFAQVPSSLSNLRKKYISTQQSSIRFDSMSVIPNTFSIQDVAAGSYDIDYVNATLLWKLKPNTDKVLLTYRVFPYRLNAVTKRFNYDSVRYNFLIEPNVFNKKTDNEKL
ncbi:MAG: hypothetical protein M3004_02445, partial [Bacteroidota bacterium]|nr:hypothetical protein [Bacteroidota bacterium]